MTTNGNTIKSILDSGIKILSENQSIENRRLDSEVLLTHILNCKRIDLIINKDKILSENETDTFYELIKKRKNNMPISYITKHREFMSLDFFVDEGILIPRPETELLVEEIIEHFKNSIDISILDLCTGSGAICVSLAHYIKSAKLTAVDKYGVCIDVAKKNAVRNCVDDRVTFLKSNVLSDFNLQKSFDCIVSNPPYIKSTTLPSLPKDVKEYEPEYALDGGDDGLIFYRKIVDIATHTLTDNGLLAFEIGYDQGEAVSKLMIESFHNVQVIKDLAGNDRVVSGVLKC